MFNKIVQNKVFKNFSYLTIGSVVSQVFSLLTILKITKILHPDDYGLYSFILAQGALVMTIADLGIMMIVVRSIARDPNRTNDLVFNGMILRILSLVVISSIYIGYNFFLGNLSNTELWMVFIFALISSFGKLFETAFLGHQKMLPTSVINLLFSFLWFGFVFILPAPILNVNTLIVSFLTLNILKNFVYYHNLKRYNLLLGKVDKFLYSSKKLLQESWPYFALTLVAMPYTKFSNNFLDINSSIDEVAFYNLSDKFTGPISLVLDIALIAIFPNFSALWVSNRKSFIELIENNFKFFMLLGMMMCFLFTVFAVEILGFLFPASYLPAVFVCQIQIWVLFLNSINSLMGTILGSTDNEKKILKIGIVNMLFSTPIVFLGSYYGAIGLSTAYLIATVIFQFYIWFEFQKTISIKIKGKYFMGLFAVILFLVSYYFASSLEIPYKILIAVGILALSGLYTRKSIIKST
jgi:O-antigen/teichoic acid export membrane protein